MRKIILSDSHLSPQTIFFLGAVPGMLIFGWVSKQYSTVQYSTVQMMSVGRQDLLLDETVANKNTVRLLL